MMSPIILLLLLLHSVNALAAKPKPRVTVLHPNLPFQMTPSQMLKYTRGCLRATRPVNPNVPIISRGTILSWPRPFYRRNDPKIPPPEEEPVLSMPRPDAFWPWGTRAFPAQRPMTCCRGHTPQPMIIPTTTTINEILLLHPGSGLRNPTSSTPR